MSLEEQILAEVHLAIAELSGPVEKVAEDIPNEVEKVVPAANTNSNRQKIATMGWLKQEFTIWEIEEILKENIFQDETSEAFIRDIPWLATKILNLIAENNNRWIVPDVDKLISWVIENWRRDIDLKMTFKRYDEIMKWLRIHGVDFNTFRNWPRETTPKTETALNLFKHIENNWLEIWNFVSIPWEIHQWKNYEIVWYTSRIYLKIKTPDWIFIISPLKVTKVSKPKKWKKR